MRARIGQWEAVMRWCHVLGSLMGLCLAFCTPAHARISPDETPLDQWAVVILAADWRASDGVPIDAFENARRALARGFAEAGFDPSRITSLSMRPVSLGGYSLTSEDVFGAFEAQAMSATAGCLIYLTSHGVPEGMVLGSEGILSPARLNALVSGWCGERPTVVVVSACYSGVFIPALAAPNRLVMTAARPDRSSFGCGPGSDYPYFDGCVLDSLPDADDFVHLASLTRRCVAEREVQGRLFPPSEPQTFVGEDVQKLFIFLDFARPRLAAGLAE